MDDQENQRLRCSVSIVAFSVFFAIALSHNGLSASPRLSIPASETEYLWYEAENMRGLTQNSRHEPLLNPSYLELPAAKAPGWGISGPGVSAEWSQGGESEWNSVAASPDETRGTISQDVEVPRSGDYKVWVRYADFANKTESFALSISQAGREIFRHEFGEQDVIDSHDETKMYWDWAFAWDAAPATLTKGVAKVSIQITKSAQARRQVDCFLLTNDSAFVPEGRRKPDFAAMRYLREWSAARAPLAPLIDSSGESAKTKDPSAPDLQAEIGDGPEVAKAFAHAIQFESRCCFVHSA